MNDAAQGGGANAPGPVVAAPKPVPAGQATGPNQPHPNPPKAPGEQQEPKKKWQPPPVREMAGPARMKRRHWGLIVSFGLMVIAPLMLVLLYMWLVAEDQYASTVGFTVRQEEDGGASAVLGGLAQLAGSSTSSDSDILYEFILSQALVRTIDEKVGLKGHYSAYWDDDPVFALSPEATIEDLQEYWERIVRISYDQGSGLMDVRVLAFDPDKAQAIARQIILEGQAMINALNEQAREDAMRYAEVELDEAVARLKEAREALTNFRTRTTIVDPGADLQGRMGVMNGLQQQLATALIEYDLLREQTNEDDPRITQVRRRIDAIRNRIDEERQAFTSDTTTNSTDGEDYPTLIAEYEGLVVDREFAEESYRASLAAVDVARAKASRQSRYLATYVQPTRAESSEYPQRLTISLLAGIFLLLLWSICALVYYSIRDRR
ncbi:sugar transporter [Pacificoceanicola onchidii]|uniref:sugar transporter n=1 Tax=Pacificoceanicola onchidii TaxID=2562685 RepID=UPI0010A620E1|nr:sugar transporter [Pacificoceanicola onchidii]